MRIPPLTTPLPSPVPHPLCLPNGGVAETREAQITAAVPSLPGCSTKGSTLEEAGRRVRDMARGYLAYSQHNGGDIPEELATESATLT